MSYLRKIAALIIVLLVSTWVFETFLLRDFLEEHAEQRLQVEKIKNCDVIYLSASSNFSQKGDEDHRKLSQMLAAEFPQKRFEAINKPASHAGIFKRLMNILPEESEVETMIVTINLRTFSADWIYSELEPALNKANLMYNNRPPLFNRVLIGLQAYESSTEEQLKILRSEAWDEESLPLPEEINSVNKWCAQPKWGDWTNPKRQLADQFIKQYAYALSENNIRIQDLDELIHLSKDRNWNLIFHILPENIELADSLVGNQLVDIIRSNAEMIVDRYTAQGIPVVNNVELLSDHHFTDRDFPTEHYDDKGRMKVAESIALRLQEL